MISIALSEWAGRFYTLLAAGLTFAAVMTFLTWRQVRDLVGLMFSILFMSLALIVSGNVWAHTGDARISMQTIVAFQRGLWAASGLCIAVLADHYTARKNDHRSALTRIRLWLKAFNKEHVKHEFRT